MRYRTDNRRQLDRRQMLRAVGGSALAAAVPLATARSEPQPAQPELRGKAPFRALFSNDTTNIRSCVSPYHKADEPFREEMLAASIDETAGTGIDVHMLQPGLGWVPWWKSESYPASEHYRWWFDKFGGEPDAIARYMIDGGDMVDVLVRRCRANDLAPFVSLRLNDYHGKEFADFTRADFENLGMPFFWVPHTNSRFYLEHPEYRVAADPKIYTSNPDVNRLLSDPAVRTPVRNARVFNWAVPEVRQQKLTFLRELAEGYDIDGLELDFLRHRNLFRQDETTRAERVEIVTDFVAEVRTLLDRTARPGRRRWLCARLPQWLGWHGAMGIDLPKMVSAGLQMINLSNHFAWSQASDLSRVVRKCPGAAVYHEMTHCTDTPRNPAPVEKGKFRYHISRWRMTTPEQFWTGAHLAYARGGQGVSAFNFVYYRASAERGGFGMEPPLDVFQTVSDPQEVARKPQHYFLKLGRRTIAPDGKLRFAIDMAPPADGWNLPGKLRVQAGKDLAGRRFEATLNGRSLEATDDVAEPYPNPYNEPGVLGRPGELRAWILPADVPIDGMNQIDIRLVEGEPSQLVFLDLAMPVATTA